MLCGSKTVFDWLEGVAIPNGVKEFDIVEVRFKNNRKGFFRVGAGAKYHVGDVVTTGSENGLSGAIANIRYYQKKLTSREITAFYNIFKKKNPPTNNL